MSKQRGGQKKICPIVCKNENDVEVTFDNGRASCIGTNYPNLVRKDCGSDSYDCPDDEEVTQKCKDETTGIIRDTKQCEDDEYLINTCETPGYMRPKTAGGKYKNKTTKKQMKKSKSKRTKHMKKSKKNKRN